MPANMIDELTNSLDTFYLKITLLLPFIKIVKESAAIVENAMILISHMLKENYPIKYDYTEYHENSAMRDIRLFSGRLKSEPNYLSSNLTMAQCKHTETTDTNLLFSVRSFNDHLHARVTPPIIVTSNFIKHRL